jgi:hypothetical protein
MPEPLAEHAEIQTLFGEGWGIFSSEDCHIFILDEILANFTVMNPWFSRRLAAL